MKEPTLFHIKIVTDEKKNRFDRDDCINNASIFSKLNLDEQAKFIGNIVNNTLNFYEECPFLDETTLHCVSYDCTKCFENWFFNMFDPDTFYKILGD